MREIADLRARAPHHLAVGVEQQVQFRRERAEIGREFAGDALGLAATDGDQALAQSAQRMQAKAHGERG